ncbi:hypothetical protein B835_1985 [Enterococcus mundtii 3F]|nr:hypothetical protein [Enterococcus mundtii 3F]
MSYILKNKSFGSESGYYVMENKKAYGFLFQIYTEANKNEWLSCPLIFVYSQGE